MSYTNVRIHKDLMQQVEARKTGWQSTTVIVNDLLALALDSSLTLGKPTAERREVLPSKAVNREKDVEISLRAEEAHIPAAAIKKAKPTHDVPGCLFPHEDLIRSYWKAKPKTKTQAAWDLLMRELTKIQDNYGDDVVRDQLVLAEAQRFQSITLKNYEQFGVPKSNAPTQSTGIDYAALDAIRTPW